MTLRKYLGSYALVAVVTVLITCYMLPELSVIGFVLIALGAVEFASEMYMKIFNDRIDVDEELQNGNMAISNVIVARYIAYAIVVGAALTAVPKAIGADYPHVEVARRYIGLVEKHGNRGAIIDQWNREAKTSLGSPYCAAFVAHCLNEAGAAKPLYRGAYSQYYIDKSSVRLPLSKPLDLEGWLLVFKRKGGGHIAIIRQGYGGLVRTIEANTSPEGIAGSQYDGGGVFERTRNLRTLSSPYNMFRATHVVPVRYSK